MKGDFAWNGYVVDDVESLWKKQRCFTRMK